MTPSGGATHLNAWGKVGSIRQLAQVVAALAFGVVMAAVLGESLARARILLMGRPLEKVTEGVVTTYDPLLGFRFIPGTHAHVRDAEFDFEFQINGHGLRMDREVSYSRPSENRRVVLIGDSFTFGGGVTNADRYGDRLEALTGVEIINMGMWGTGTDQQLLLYLTKGRRYDADVVVLAYLIENIQRNASTARLQANGMLVPKPKFTIEDGRLVLVNVPVPKVAVGETDEREKWRARQAEQSTGLPIPFREALARHSALYQFLRARLALGVKALLGAGLRPYPEYDPDREEWRLTRTLLANFAHQVRIRRSQFLLVVIPTSDYVYGRARDDAPFRLLHELAAQEGIPILDLLPGLRAEGAHTSEPLYYPVDGHLTPVGHAVAAKLLAERLKQLGSSSRPLGGQPPVRGRGR